MHFHGLFSNGTNYWDGVSMVTQCPIPYNDTMHYEVLNSPRQSERKRYQWGSFWAHSHYGGNYVDSVKLPMPIHRTGDQGKEHYDYDDDYTVVITDWYHKDFEKILTTESKNIRNPTARMPIPPSALMYFYHTKAGGPPIVKPLPGKDGKPGINMNARLKFEPGKTYRLRLMNIGAMNMFHFWLEGHDMDVIEADGTDVER